VIRRAISCIYTLHPICFVHGFISRTSSPVPAMPTPAPLNPKSTPVTPGDPVAAETFEYRLHKFWENYANAVYLFCAIVLIAIIGKGVYDFYTARHENEIGADYAAASTSEKLRAFVAAHPGHQLAGVARLRLGDEAFSNGNFTQAATEYQAAAEALKTGPFAGRARLGNAMTKFQTGQTSEAQSQLKQLSNDAAQMKAVRAEAAYQLASEAAGAGRNDEALKYLDQVMTIEQAGTWAQRAMMLRATLPAPTASLNVPAVGTTPAANLPAKP